MCLVFNLQLHPGPNFMLGVPEDQLRAKNDYDADGRGGLQHHYSTDTRSPAG